MKTGLGILLLAVLSLGCGTTRPLSSVPQAKTDSLYIDVGDKAHVEVVCWTARGRNAELAGSTGGLIGALVGQSVAAGDESRGVNLVKTLRARNDNCEMRLVLDALKSKLAEAGLQISDNFDTRARLSVAVQTVGLRENQRGYWVPCLRLRAELTDGGKETVWQAFASSTGTHPRALEEYAADPLHYGKDFVEVAEDVVRQLVIGPIRN